MPFLRCKSAAGLRAFLIVLPLCLSPIRAAEKVVVLDAAQGGRTFEGIGALSAGASSKLLIDYPEPQRRQVLDVLFKPKYGASLQHLKVEIGGDVNSTCGTEPAFAHTRDEFLKDDPGNFRRGYEGWLMREAFARAPRILFDALQWGAPGWIGGGSFFSQDNADFVAAFHARTRRYLGIETAFQGIWNETAYDIGYIKMLRRTLDRAGLSSVKIGAADQDNKDRIWRIAEEVARDPELARAIYAYGDHYVAYASTETARVSGKPLWASEDGPWAGDWYAATKLAKLYNRSYIDGRMTRFITWSLVTSYYDILPLPGSGLMRASEPWSGHYEIQPAIWAAAHTTQFAEPGWKYIDSGCGHLEPFGSYVTLRSPGGADYSIVVETMDSPYITIGAPIEIEFQLGRGFGGKAVCVWKSSAREQFIQVATIEPKGSSIRYRFDPESIYTLSTTTGQRKGGCDLPIPAGRILPLPYSDNFDAIPEHALPRFFIDQSGVFEVVRRPDGTGGCLRQMVPARGIEWGYHGNPEPYTVMGDERWTDYEVQADAQIDAAASASIYGRVSNVGTKAEPPRGYRFTVDGAGAWKLERDAESLGSGRVVFATGGWHRLSLTLSGATISAAVDGTRLTRIEDRAYTHGLAGLGTTFSPTLFDSFKVTGTDLSK
jgi:hypothetical protein